MTEMTEPQARTILVAMHASKDNEVFSLTGRIEELEDDYQKDPWSDTKAQIDRLKERLEKRKLEVSALAIAIGHLPLDASRETHDIYKAWAFVAESYEPFSPNRSAWTDEDIFNFVDQHHTIGLDAFKKN